MKGRKLTLVLVALLVFVCLFALAGCHEHTFEAEWTSDNSGHWHKATCKHSDEIGDYEAHTLFTVEAKAATCTSEGNNQYYYCGECRKAFKDEAMTMPTYDYAEVIPATGHVYNQKVVAQDNLAQAATCSSKATYYYVCACGAVGTDTFESGEFAAHNLQLVPAVAATCETTGNNAYYTCSDCGLYFKDQNATVYTSPEAEVTPVAAHVLTHHEGIVATCTSEGQAEYWTCNVCDKMYEDATASSQIFAVRILGKTSHNYANIASEEYKATEADCKTLATYYTSCVDCGAKGTTTFEFGSFGSHVLQEVAAKAPTCTMPGNQKYYSCTVCFELYADLAATTVTTEEAMALAATGHKYDQKVIDDDYKATDATCKTPATYYMSCVCGYLNKSESTTFSGTALAQHVPGTVVVYKAPTCTETGVIEHFICGVCEAYYRYDENGNQKTTILVGNENKVLDANTVVIPCNHDQEGWYQEIVDAACIQALPTCTTYAVYYKSCPDCGAMNDETFKTDIKLPHTYAVDENGDRIFVAGKDATCTEEGVIAHYTCTVCQNSISVDGKVLESTVISTAGAHQWGKVAVDAALISPATCDKAATYAHSCVKCGTVLADYDAYNAANPDAQLEPWEYLDPLGHVVGDLIAATPADCLTDGIVAHYECSRCGKFLNENKEVIETIVETRLGHDFTEQIIDEAHLSMAATCHSLAIYRYDCSRCDTISTKTYTHGEYAPHTVGELSQAKEPTCVDEGKIAYYYCQVCEQYLNENFAEVTKTTIDPLGHDWTAQKQEAAYVKNVATCYSLAEYYYGCTRCDAKHDTRTFFAGEYLDHDYSDMVPEKLATCTEKGNIEYCVCQNEGCGKYFNKNLAEVDSVETAALNHDFQKQIVTDEYLASPASCIALAQYYYACSREDCGEKGTRLYSEPNGKYADHVYGALQSAVAGDCTTDGCIAHYQCTVVGCGQYKNEAGEEVSSVVITAPGHDFTSKIQTELYYGGAATCETAEYYYYACANCQEKSTTETYTVGDALPHAYGAWVEGEPASCTKDGIMAHYQCANCSKYFDANKVEIADIVVKQYGHDWNETVAEAFRKSVATCASKAVYYYSCSRIDCGCIDYDRTFEYGSLDTTHDGSTLIHVDAVDEFTVGSFPATCNYEHYKCQLCGKFFADAAAKNEFTLNNGNPYYQMARPTMAIGYMANGAFVISETATLAHATGYSYTIGGMIPYVNDNWGVQGLVGGNRVALQFAASIMSYAATQTGAVAILTSGDYTRTYNASDLQAGNESLNIEAKSLLILFNVHESMTLEILTGENTWTTYTFKLATSIVLTRFVPTTEPTYWVDGNYDYYVCKIDGVDGEDRYFKDGFCKEEITDLSAYIIPRLEVEVELGEVKDNNFVKFDEEFTATLTEGNARVYVLNGAVIVDENGKATIAIRFNAEFAKYFQYVADNEVVLKLNMNGNVQNFKLPEFDFAQDGTLVKTFDVVAGATYQVELRDPKSETNWLDFTIVIDESVVCPTKVEAIEASYWTEGRKEHYTLTDELGEVSYFEDVYCTIATTKEAVISAQLEIAVSVDADLTYTIERTDLGLYTVKGIVLYNEATESHYIAIRFAKDFLSAYANYDKSVTIIKIVNSNGQVINLTLADCEALINVSQPNEETGEDETVVLPYLTLEANAALKDVEFSFSFVNPADAQDWMKYVVAIDNSVYCPMFVEAYAPTYFEVGMAEHFVCLRTGKFFADETCEEEIAEADLAVAKLLPTAQAGSYDSVNNAFVLGGVYYTVTLNENNVYVIDGTVLKTERVAGVASDYKYVIRFNDDFASYYTDLADDMVLVKIKLADGATANHNNENYAGYNVFTKASGAFEADGSIVFISDSFRTDLIEYCLWNPVSNTWETYYIQVADSLVRVEFFANAQVGSILEDGTFLTERYVLADGTTIAPLQYSVALTENGVYEISGIIPSLFDEEGMETKEYRFNLRFNYDFASVFATAANDMVVARYVYPDGTTKDITKAEAFANDVSICFTGDALAQGSFKLQIMTADGSAVWMEYQIAVAEDAVCPYYVYQKAPDYWTQGYRGHYVNYRSAGIYYEDYACTQVIDTTEGFFTDILVFDGMEAGSYVADGNGGYKFGSYDHIEYFVTETNGSYVVSGKVNCYNDKSNEATKQLHQFVIKVKGTFAKYYELRDASTVILKMVVKDADGNVVEERSFTKAEVKFEADGSIVLIHEAVKGYVIEYSFLDPMTSTTGTNEAAQFSLVYTVEVSNNIEYVHNSKHLVKKEANYWHEGERYAQCTDCGVETDLVEAERRIEKLVPAITSTGATIVYNAGAYTATVNAEGNIVINLPAEYLACFANDTDVVVVIDGTSYTKAEAAQGITIAATANAQISITLKAPVAADPANQDPDVTYTMTVVVVSATGTDE